MGLVQITSAVQKSHNSTQSERTFEWIEDDTEDNDASELCTEHIHTRQHTITTDHHINQLATHSIRPTDRHDHKLMPILIVNSFTLLQRAYRQCCD